jgi:hypothetical protein
MTFTSKVVSKTPWKQRWKHSDEELIVSAAEFKHRADWKKANPEKYNAAWRRGLLDKCCAHMTPAANPYAKDYIIYVYEFADHYAYVGLTFRQAHRHALNMARGPVHEHMKICTDYTYKVVERSIPDPIAAGGAEKKWQLKYIDDNWIPLWTNKAGGLGSLLISKWTKEAVIAEAKKYTTKQTWIDSSQMSYRIAKREGWFAEASAHMPKHDAKHLIGRKISKASKKKMRAAKLGKKQSESHRKARSVAIKTWWTTRRQISSVSNLIPG